jgi:hypothetical protein
MNFKSILALTLGVATIGLSLPALADDAKIVTTDQDVVVTGDGNHTTQNSRTSVYSNQQKNKDSSGTDVMTKQRADILGDDNQTKQDSNTRIENIRRKNR